MPLFYNFYRSDDFCQDSTNIATSSGTNTAIDLFSANSTIPKKKKDPKHERITQAIANLIAQDMLPTSIVEGKGFVNLLKIVCPLYKVPSRSTIGERINGMYLFKQTDIKNEMNSAASVAITTDCWTSRTSYSYMTVTVHYLTENFINKGFALTTMGFEDRHTSVNLSNNLMDILTEWKIETKVVATVHDNASNITKAIREEKLFGLSIPCFAHSLQLCLNKALMETEIDNLVTKCSAIVTFMHHSTVASNALLKLQRSLEIPERKLIQKCSTRWNSCLYMLESLSAQKTAITAVLGDRLVTSKSKSDKCSLCNNEWNIIDEVINVLKPFDIATSVMSSEKNETLSLIRPVVFNLKTKFLDKDILMESALIKKIKKNISSEIVSRFLKISETVSAHAIASYFDPRFKAKQPYFDVRELELVS